MVWPEEDGPEGSVGAQFSIEETPWERLSPFILLQCFASGDYYSSLENVCVCVCVCVCTREHMCMHPCMYVLGVGSILLKDCYKELRESGGGGSTPPKPQNGHSVDGEQQSLKSKWSPGEQLKAGGI